MAENRRNSFWLILAGGILLLRQFGFGTGTANLKQ
jgi:hypothetical protein